MLKNFSLSQFIFCQFKRDNRQNQTAPVRKLIHHSLPQGISLTLSLQTFHSSIRVHSFLSSLSSRDLQPTPSPAWQKEAHTAVAISGHSLHPQGGPPSVGHEELLRSLRYILSNSDGSWLLCFITKGPKKFF